ncbi:hypothetical protein 3 [Hubei tombus-like virus 14]|uniref:hypothetical protein 3 n=1 Tax=Hubei tombus-like virus 14 TaxID=1923260 RepID=UPI00090AE58F|nr:hypothetical protein 3 [Hubei tombus-like virus 14]APG76383.1 hypothetical protein 3 [Hubei tombus-like virus 14]
MKTPDPQVNSAEWKQFRKVLRELSDEVGSVPKATPTTVVNHRNSMKKRRFGKGMEIYLREGVAAKHSYITMMPKLEFYDSEKIPLKEDRGIQYRSPVYNAALARHLHHVEEQLYKTIKNVDGTPVFAKGYSPMERALIIDAMASRFKEPMFLLADHHRFDAHVNGPLLDEEHRFYLRCRRWNLELRQLLEWQKKNKGVSHGGGRYRMRAKRMSGDLNTSLGNSVINYGVLKAFCKHFNIDASMFIDGDDSIMIMEKQHLPDLVAFAEKFGLVTEVEVVHDIRHAEFCQSRIIYLEKGPIMVRNPWKIMDCMCKSPRKLRPEQARGVLAATALCELMQSPGVPVIAPCASALLTYAGGKPMFITPTAWGKFQGWQTDQIVDIVDESARADLEFAWGMTISEQLMMEEHYKHYAREGVTIQMPNPKSKPKEIEFEIWDAYQTQYQPTEVRRWWRDRWEISQYLPPLDPEAVYYAELLG